MVVSLIKGNYLHSSCGQVWYFIPDHITPTLHQLHWLPVHRWV